jgi:Protein of unknown function (DUF2934)
MTPNEDRKPAMRTRKPRATPRAASAPMPDDRARRIAEQAYYLAEARGFAPGGELEDWLAAERLIDGCRPS